jgi:hypothetical protein
LIKTAVLLGVMASLVGCMKASPVAVKANGRINVHIEADLDASFGKAKAALKVTRRAAKSKKAAVTTKARTVKGKGTMNNTLINTVTNNGGQAMVAAGEMAPNRRASIHATARPLDQEHDQWVQILPLLPISLTRTTGGNSARFRSNPIQ